MNNPAEDTTQEGPGKREIGEVRLAKATSQVASV